MRWSYAKGLPSKLVRNFGCELSGFSESSSVPVERLELPAASSVMILCCGEPVTLRPALSARSTSRCTAFSAGLQLHAQRVLHSGVNDCVEIRLPPLTAYTMFGGAMVEPSSAPVDLLDVTRESTLRLLEVLQTTSVWQDRFNAVDDFLSRALRASQRHIPPQLMWAWRALESSHGQVPVHWLAAEVEWSERHLINQFRAYFGSRPKAVARRLRFARAFNLLALQPAGDLCAIALQSGFSDQSHMTREFRHFAGLTPNVLREARFCDLPGIPAGILDRQ